jgi:NYN domain
MTLYVYVDNSSLSIEGQRLSAVKSGLAFDMHDAISRDVTDYSWRCDMGALHRAVCPPNESIGGSSLFGTRPHDDDSLWSMAAEQGFDVDVIDGNAASKVDVAVTTKIMADSYEHMQPGDTAVLVAGDRDYLPVIESLRSRRLGVLVAFWEHATARAMKSPPDEFFSLDAHFEDLSR